MSPAISELRVQPSAMVEPRKLAVHADVVRLVMPYVPGFFTCSRLAAYTSTYRIFSSSATPDFKALLNASVIALITVRFDAACASPQGVADRSGRLLRTT